MKTRKIITGLFFLAFTMIMQGQINSKGIISPQVVKINPVSKKCMPLNIKTTENILRDKVGRTLKIYMDRDYGYVEIMGKRQNIRFNEFKVKKPAHNWLYFLNDVKSEITRVKYADKKFVLTVKFEKERNEIKGKCPGCRVGKDKRAPDINWEDPKLKIELVPVAYNGSFTFEVKRVRLLGKFKMNGPMQKIFPQIIAFFKSAIRKKIKNQIKAVLNRDAVKNMLAEAFKNEVKNLGLGTVKRIDMSRDNIYLCNY